MSLSFGAGGVAASSGDGGGSSSGGLEASVVGDAKGKAETLYYTTLEV